MDTSKLSPQEQRLYKLYGKLPTRSELLLKKKLKGGEGRKFFDSGDYALSQAGKSTDAAGGNIDADIGAKRHADLGDIPHYNGSNLSNGSSVSSSDGGSDGGNMSDTNAGSSINGDERSKNGLNNSEMTRGGDEGLNSDNNMSGSSNTTAQHIPIPRSFILSNNNNINTHNTNSNTSSPLSSSPPIPNASNSFSNSGSNLSPSSSTPVRPPRSPHAAPASLMPGEPGLSSNSVPAPVTAAVRESSKLLNETSNEDLMDED